MFFLETVQQCAASLLTIKIEFMIRCSETMSTPVTAKRVSTTKKIWIVRGPLGVRQPLVPQSSWRVLRLFMVHTSKILLTLLIAEYVEVLVSVALASLLNSCNLIERQMNAALYCVGCYIPKWIEILLATMSMGYHWLVTDQNSETHDRPCVYDSLIREKGPCIEGPNNNSLRPKREQTRDSNILHPAKYPMDFYLFFD